MAPTLNPQHFAAGRGLKNRANALVWHLVAWMEGLLEYGSSESDGEAHVPDGNPITVQAAEAQDQKPPRKRPRTAAGNQPASVAAPRLPEARGPPPAGAAVALPSAAAVLDGNGEGVLSSRVQNLSNTPPEWQHSTKAVADCLQVQWRWRQPGQTTRAASAASPMWRATTLPTFTSQVLAAGGAHAARRGCFLSQSRASSACHLTLLPAGPAPAVRVPDQAQAPLHAFLQQVGARTAW